MRMVLLKKPVLLQRANSAPNVPSKYTDGENSGSRFSKIEHSISISSVFREFIHLEVRCRRIIIPSAYTDTVPSTVTRSVWPKTHGVHHPHVSACLLQSSDCLAMEYECQLVRRVLRTSFVCFGGCVINPVCVYSEGYLGRSCYYWWLDKMCIDFLYRSIKLRF
jgi:hypothetical protein